MSTINSKNVQVGTSSTAAENFTLYQPATPDGTVRLGVGNSGATTGDVVTVNSSGVTVTGTLAATSISASGASLTGLNASNLSTGTVAKARLPAGSVLQVVQGVKTDTFVTSPTATDVAVTGLTVSITPTSSTSRILVICNLGIAAENAQGGAAKLTRTVSAVTTQLSLADAAGSRSRGSFAGSGYRGSASSYTLMVWHQSLTFLDSPATTSAITYGVQVSSITNGTWINRSETDTNGADTYRGVSYITAMEIAV